jgi:hypothetical protein
MDIWVGRGRPILGPKIQSHTIGFRGEPEREKYNWPPMILRNVKLDVGKHGVGARTIITLEP